MSEPGKDLTLDYASCTPALRLPFWYLRWSILVFFLAFIVRYAYSAFVTYQGRSLDALPDQLEYIGCAYRWAGQLGMSFFDPLYQQTVWAYRMPGYPAFIAFFQGEEYRIRGAQAALDACCALMIYWVGRRFDEPTGRVASLFVALNPFLLYFSSLFLSETLFTAMLTIGVYRLLSDYRWKRVTGVLVLIASVYVRPSAAGLGVLAAMVAFGFDAANRFRLRRSLFAGVAAACLTVAILVPWASRNQYEVNAWVWLTTNDGYTWYDSFNPQADGSSNQAFFRNDPALWYRGEAGRSAYLKQQAFEYIKTHPARVVSLAFAKLGRFWAPWPLSADFGGKWYYVAVGAAYTVPLFLFAAVGVWRGRMPGRAKLILLLPALYFSAVHSVFVGSLRYRVPCDVPLAVLAAAGVTSFAKPKPPVVGDAA